MELTENLQEKSEGPFLPSPRNLDKKILPNNFFNFFTVGCLFTMSTAHGVDLGNLNPIQKYISEELEWGERSPELIGLASAIPLYFTIIFFPFSDYILKHWRKNTIIIFIDVVVIFGSILSCFPSTFALFAGRALCSLLSTGLSAVMTAMNENLVPATSSTYISAQEGLFLVGYVIIACLSLFVNEFPHLIKVLALLMPGILCLINLVLMLLFFNVDTISGTLLSESKEDTKKVLKLFYDSEEDQKDVEEILRYRLSHASRSFSLIQILKDPKRRLCFLACIPCLIGSEFSGFSIITAYSFRIFNYVSSASFITFGVSLCSMLGIISFVMIIHYVRPMRKRMAVIGTLLSGFALVCLSSAFFSTNSFIQISFIFVVDLLSRAFTRSFFWLYITEVNPASGINFLMILHFIASSINLHFFPILTSYYFSFGDYFLVAGIIVLLCALLENKLIVEPTSHFSKEKGAEKDLVEEGEAELDDF